MLVYLPSVRHLTQEHSTFSSREEHLPYVPSLYRGSRDVYRSQVSVGLEWQNQLLSPLICRKYIKFGLWGGGRGDRRPCFVEARTRAKHVLNNRLSQTALNVVLP